MNFFGEIQYQYHQVCSKVDTRPTPVQISKPQIRSSAIYLNAYKDMVQIFKIYMYNYFVLKNLKKLCWFPKNATIKQIYKKQSGGETENRLGETGGNKKKKINPNK